MVNVFVTGRAGIATGAERERESVQNFHIDIRQYRRTEDWRRYINEWMRANACAGPEACTLYAGR